MNGDPSTGGKNGEGRGGGGGGGRGGGGGLRNGRSSDRSFLPLPGGQPTDTSLQIDINVIQPTPNISPTHSLRSFSAEERDGIESSNTFAGENEVFKVRMKC